MSNENNPKPENKYKEIQQRSASLHDVVFKVVSVSISFKWVFVGVGVGHALWRVRVPWSHV